MRLRELDGWRAVSVMLVIGFHIGAYQHHRLIARLPHLDRVVRHSGPLGVEVFFVISGFVICRLLISEELRYGSVCLSAFYFRRAFRILPPLFVYLGVVSIFFRLGLLDGQLKDILGAVLMVRDTNLLPHGSWFVGHTWSLAVEEQFYLLFPSLWILIPKGWRGRVFAALFISCGAWNFSVAYAHWPSRFYPETRVGFACIVCGILMAIYEIPARSFVNSVPGFIVALVGLALLVHPVASNGWQAALYESLAVPPAIGLVLLASLGRGAWLRAFLCSKPLQAVGLTSYGIYLWQQLFTASKADYFGPGKILAVCLPALCLVVPFSYYLLEKPAMRYGRLLSDQSRLRAINTAALIEE